MIQRARIAAAAAAAASVGERHQLLRHIPRLEQHQGLLIRSGHELVLRQRLCNLAFLQSVGACPRLHRRACTRLSWARNGSCNILRGLLQVCCAAVNNAAALRVSE